MINDGCAKEAMPTAKDVTKQRLHEWGYDIPSSYFEHMKFKFRYPQDMRKLGGDRRLLIKSGYYWAKYPEPELNDEIFIVYINWNLTGVPHFVSFHDDNVWWFPMNDRCDVCCGAELLLGDRLGIEEIDFVDAKDPLRETIRNVMATISVDESYQKSS